MDKILMNKDNNVIINELIELINSFSLIIYKKQNEECYKLLINVIDKLGSIIDAKSSLDIENSYKNYIQDLRCKLPALLDAFENSDNVLISDILQYEIKPILGKLT